MSVSCTVSEILSLIYQWSRDPEHTSFGAIRHAMINLNIKFEVLELHTFKRYTL